MKTYLFAATVFLVVVFASCSSFRDRRQSLDDAGKFAETRGPKLQTIALYEDRRLSVEVLRGYLTDPDPVVRSRAAIAIGRCSDKESLKDFESCITRGTDLGTLESCIYAIGLTRDSMGRGLVGMFLSHGNPRIRSAATEAYALLGAGMALEKPEELETNEAGASVNSEEIDEEKEEDARRNFEFTLAPWRLNLMDEDENVRFIAAANVWRFFPGRDKLPKGRKPYVPQNLAEDWNLACVDDSPRVRSAAWQSLYLARVDPWDETISLAAELDEPESMMFALVCAARLKAGQSVDMLLNTSVSRDYRVNVNLIGALGGLKSEAGLARLLELFPYKAEDENEPLEFHYKKAMCAALANSADLAKQSVLARYYLLRCLGFREDEAREISDGSIRDVGELVRTSKIPRGSANERASVVEKAIGAYAEVFGAEGIKVVGGLAYDSDPIVASAALSEIHRKPDMKSVELLEDFAVMDHFLVRAGVASSYAEILKKCNAKLHPEEKEEGATDENALETAEDTAVDDTNYDALRNEVLRRLLPFLRDEDKLVNYQAIDGLSSEWDYRILGRLRAELSAHPGFEGIDIRDSAVSAIGAVSARCFKNYLDQILSADLMDSMPFSIEVEDSGQFTESVPPGVFRLARNQLSSFILYCFHFEGTADLAELYGAVRALERACEDPSIAVRNSAKAAIEKIVSASMPSVGEPEAGSLEARQKQALESISVHVATDRADTGTLPFDVQNDLLSGRVNVLLETTKGDIRLELDADVAPMHVTNYVILAKRGFYDNNVIHRAEPNWVLQFGCPRGDGWGDAGYLVRHEVNPQYFDEGIVGLATSGPDTGSCQPFIMIRPGYHLNEVFTAFGKVTEGMAVVHLLDKGDVILRVTVE
ncbi:MAG: peptidylprolyl isomerase [Planctomycetes bacterium]|nr:peptidylprolyl isomerase [Planctomycetota bacterium]